MSHFNVSPPSTTDPPGDPPDFLRATLSWFNFGLQVIPIVPTKKRTSVPWDLWLEDLSEQKISEYWGKHPNYEVGFIVGSDFVVFDADSARSQEALCRIEKTFDCTPDLIVDTSKGQHHLFKLKKGTCVRQVAYGTAEKPENIDVKTGRGLIILPPSTGKSVRQCDVEHADDLKTVDQDFVDAIFQHNGEAAPRPPLPLPKVDRVPTVKLSEMEKLLGLINPDVGYGDWFGCMAAIFHETKGSQEGIDLFDAWSSKGSKYKGRKEIESSWRSLKGYVDRPITIATLIKMAKDAGADLGSVLDDDFEVCETVVDKANPPAIDGTRVNGTVFDKYSLTGKSAELELVAHEPVYVLGEYALEGQSTALCAEGNTGKTLLVLRHLAKAIEEGRVDPAKTYYLNCDDSYTGLIVKVRIAEEYGFHMLAEGQEGFSYKSFLDDLRALIKDDHAHGVIVILDTLKKFVDVMKKSECRDFNTVLRQFTSKGGTIIALAHTNKKKDASGRPVFGGTSDLKDDFDCMYILSRISERGAREQVVLFENEKCRGPVVQKAAYQFTYDQDSSYEELFLSVEEIDETQAISIKQAEEIRSDADVIAAVISCINNGVNSKMKLGEAAAKLSGASKRSVLQIIDKYTGEVPEQHRWYFDRGERGRQTFYVLDEKNPSEQSKFNSRSLL